MFTNHKPVDTTAPLSFFSHQGYYVVGKDIFRNKVYAMQEATRKRMSPEEMRWVFNDETFKKLDWKNSSGVSLTELYRMGAQQLREKYNYLILTFSGGGDSTNVLDSFILNNIHLDEVVVTWARSQTAGRYTPSLNTDATNYNSEWDFLVEPKLKWLEKVAPKTKITILDNFEDMRPEEPYDDFMSLTGKHGWQSIKRWAGVDQLLMSRQEQHKNCAVIMGVNPPLVCRLKRHFLAFFADGQTTTYMSDYTPRGERKIEFFYWTPDMPEIVKEQSHALLKNLKLNPQFQNLIQEIQINKSETTTKLTKRQREDQRRWIKSVLYPTYDYQSLQVDKNSRPIGRSEWFSWLFNNPHSEEIVQPHFSAVTSHQNIIDPRFFVSENEEVCDYRPYFSKFYYIGDL